MAGLLQIAIYTGLLLTLTGCAAKEQKPIWADTKLWQLAPLKSPIQKDKGQIQLEIYTLQVPAENSFALDEIRAVLYTKPLKYNNRQAFEKNLFTAGFGRVEQLEHIGDQLSGAGALAKRTTSLFIVDGQTDQLVIRTIKQKKNIFYITETGDAHSVDIAPGILVFRIKSEAVAAAGRLHKISVWPVATEPKKSTLPQLAEVQKQKEFALTTLGFNVKLAPGEFVFLGPARYIERQSNAASLFFCINQPQQFVRIYFLICKGIK